MIFFRKRVEKELAPEDAVQGDEILAWLDELVRLKAPISLLGNSGRYETSLATLDEKGGRARLLGALPSQARDVSRAGFALDRMWWMFGTQITQEQGKFFLTLPQSLVRKERRAEPRTSFSRREEVKVTILQGLGSGVGILGSALTISAHGLSVFIKNAMNLADEKPIQPHPGLLGPGTDLMLVRLQGLPGLAQFEGTGKVVRLARDNGMKLALLTKFEEGHTQAITRFVEGRQVEYRRTRRMRRPEENLQEPSQRQSPGENSASSTPAAQTGSEQLPSALPVEASISQQECLKQTKVPGAATGAASKTPAPVMVLGNDIERWVRFECESESLRFLMPQQVEAVVADLKNEKPLALLFQSEFLSLDGIEFLTQLKGAGLLEGVRLFLCGHQLGIKDKVRARLVQTEAAWDLASLQRDQVLETLLSL